MKLKSEPNRGTVKEILSWHSDISELAEEMRSWEENLGGSSLSGTAKYEEVSEAADTLENAAQELERACDSLADELGGWAEKTFVSFNTQRPYGKRSPARWLRLSNACAGLNEALEATKERAEELTKQEGVEMAPVASPVEPAKPLFSIGQQVELKVGVLPRTDSCLGCYSGFIMEIGEFSMNIACSHGGLDCVLIDDIVQPLQPKKPKRVPSNDLEGYISEIEDALSELDGVNFPSMY